MEKIKVLHITQAVIGGTLEYLKLFFSHIDKEKYEVELVCPSYGPMKDEISSMGIKVHVIEMNRKISIIDDYRAYRQLKKYIKESKPDIVHLHSSKAGVLGRLAAYKNKIPCVYNAHGWSFAMDVSKVKKNFYAFIERVMAKITYKIINISNFEQELAIRYKITSEERMQVIYNGIDLSKYNEKFNKEKILNELKILNHPFIIGMVARLTKQKSPETFIKVAKEVSREVKNSYFIFVGDGELRDEIEELIAKEGLKDRFLITGWTNEVGKYISIFDVGVLTSKWEGFGLALLEYMALGKPVIASKVGGIPDVIQNYNNGILVKAQNIQGFVNAIKEIDENQTLKNQMIENGYKCLREEFNIERVIYEHDVMYIEIINSMQGR